jgi:hypothetical protein
MTEVEIQGETYQLGKMSGREQFHIFKKFLRVIRKLGGENMSILDTLAEMSDEDSDAVMDKCLDLVKRRQGNAWMPIKAVGAAHRFMFEDVRDSLNLQMELTNAVLGANLENFSPAASQTSPTETPESPTIPSAA